MLRVLTAALTAKVLLTTALGPAPAPGWVVAPEVPLPMSAAGLLRDVSVVSPTDAWVVGSWIGGRRHTLAVHWVGEIWVRVPTPDAPDDSAEYILSAVDAVAADDVWAAGGIHNVASPAVVTPLFLHYDGVAWTVAPQPSGVAGELADIDLLTADEGWAVGTNQARPLIMRRIAGGWQPVPAPAIDSPASLESVYVTSPDDAWAVGFRQRGTRKTALVLHWDGRSWSEVAVPNVPPGNTALVNVAATSASDVWAVGSQCVTGPCLPWVLHLAGGVWRTEPTAASAELSSVVAFAPDDVWIFGQVATTTSAADHVEHWDGTRFTRDSTIPPTNGSPHHPASALSLAAASGHGQTRRVWAVGWVQGGGQRFTHAIYR